MSWKYFVGSSILTIGLLIKFGAPLAPIALGLAGAAYLQARRHRRMAAVKKQA